MSGSLQAPDSSQWANQYSTEGYQVRFQEEQTEPEPQPSVSAMNSVFPEFPTIILWLSCDGKNVGEYHSSLFGGSSQLCHFKPIKPTLEEDKELWDGSMMSLAFTRKYRFPFRNRAFNKELLGRVKEKKTKLCWNKVLCSVSLPPSSLCFLFKFQVIRVWLEFSTCPDPTLKTRRKEHSMKIWAVSVRSQYTRHVALISMGEPEAT